MKKLNLLITTLVGIILLSCSSDDNNNGEPNPGPSQKIKLLKKMTFSGGANYSLNFYYNSDDTIDKIESSGTGNDLIKQFFYNNGILERTELQDFNEVPNGTIEQYIYDNGQLIERLDFFNNTTLDERFVYSFSNGQIVNIKYFGFNQTSYSEQYIFQYDSNENVISRKTDYVDNSIISDEEFTFTYDDKKNPFINFEPSIVLIDDFFSFKNNPTSQILTDLSNSNLIFQKNYTYTYDSDDYAISRTDGIETIIYEYYE